MTEKKKGLGDVIMLLGFEKSIQQVNSRHTTWNILNDNSGILIVGIPFFYLHPKLAGVTVTVVGVTNDVFLEVFTLNIYTQIQHDRARLIETSGSVSGRKNKIKRQCYVKLLQSKVRRVTCGLLCEMLDKEQKEI